MKELLELAYKARANAYCPYSKFAVGAAFAAAGFIQAAMWRTPLLAQAAVQSGLLCIKRSAVESGSLRNLPLWQT